eukprot:m.149019 g.149019  ORF g.149019 m.149019 type:complete len:114 (-) comp17801_c0_seq44:1096-1437(-)
MKPPDNVSTTSTNTLHGEYGENIALRRGGVTPIAMAASDDRIGGLHIAVRQTSTNDALDAALLTVGFPDDPGHHVDAKLTRSALICVTDAVFSDIEVLPLQIKSTFDISYTKM